MSNHGNDPGYYNDDTDGAEPAEHRHHNHQQRRRHHHHHHHHHHQPDHRNSQHHSQHYSHEHPPDRGQDHRHRNHHPQQPQQQQQYTNHSRHHHNHDMVDASTRDNNASGGDDKIKVIVRVRPILRHDKDTVPAVKATANKREIEVVAGDQLKSFAFNLCCGPDVTQAELFDMSGIRKLVTDAMRGYKNTCFAYGQTGSGKTFTMSGVEEKLDSGDYGLDNPTQGIITRALQYLFDCVSKDPEAEAYRIEASAIEIYNERVYDLLYYTGKPLPVRQSKLRGFIPENLRTFLSPDMARMALILQEAHKNRRVASHDVHADSSRSHAVFTIHVNHRDFPERGGQLTFVDLAGSEKVANTGAAGKMLKEANFINKSLFTLGKVISKLSHPSFEPGVTHVPFRDSALTKLLQDSFTGGTQTIMIACVSPGASSLEETVNTAQYATRAKNIVNKPTLLIDPEKRLKADLLREVKQLRSDNARLCRQLEGLGVVPVTISGAKSPPPQPPRQTQDGGRFGSGSSQSMSRPGSGFSTRSAPSASTSRGSDMQRGFLPPIYDGPNNGGLPPRAQSDVYDSTDRFPDTKSYSHGASSQFQSSSSGMREEYPRRPHGLSPLDNAPRGPIGEGSYDDDDSAFDSVRSRRDNSAGGRGGSDSDSDGDEQESHSSSASVDSETGERVFDYNGEVWDQDAGRFVARSPVSGNANDARGRVSPQAAAALGGRNPVVAAYDGAGAGKTGSPYAREVASKSQSASPAAGSSPGYAARALLKKQLYPDSGKKLLTPSKAKSEKKPSGYLAQFKQGRVPR